ncbi:rRNA adenine N-6-methyltransferase family protein [Nocardioides litoris]|uniref:rRNA adenine N-6-methyltransferase family protein n=1 Tax=Nocardioides litoris TaxID=1926648 RepID=UPI00111DE2FD|nr:rRNA adenine N-6-methyltransferase family protein [Nocardioides litoris]
MPGPQPGRPDRWGWHPLSDAAARRLVADAPVGSGDLVLDPGAGRGAITRPLLATGARGLAVELHAGRLRTLHDLAVDEPRLTVIRADVRDLRLPRRPFRAVGSPPYDGTSALLARLLTPGSRLVSADLVVQRGLARRWAEGRAPGAGRWSRRWSVEVGRAVPRRAFARPPRVDSVVLRARLSTGGR